jgi:hypothetical protein
MSSLVSVLREFGSKLDKVTEKMADWSIEGKSEKAVRRRPFYKALVWAPEVSTFGLAYLLSDHVILETIYVAEGLSLLIFDD